MSSQLPKRSDVPTDQTWNLEGLFTSDAAWRAALESVGQNAAKLAPFQGQLATSATTLRDALELRDQLGLDAYKIAMYASLQASTDGGNAAFSSMNAQASSLQARVGAAGAFIEPEILTMPMDTLNAFVQQDARLAVYAHAFDALQQRKPHVRNAEVESLLAQVSDPLGSVYAVSNATTDADMTFRSITGTDANALTVSHSSIGELLAHTDAGVRQAAWESYADGHLALQNTLAATLQGSVKGYVFQTRARAYPSALEMALASNHIPRSVYDHLLETFKQNLPTWHRYWKLRQKAAGGKMHNFDAPIYESPAPMTPSPKISFERASTLILEGMAPLGREYTEPARRGLLTERWVDFAQNEGKSAGAYSSGTKGTAPYIFMSWSDDLFSLSTLAHELGHSMHSYFTNQTQPYAYTDYSMFVAEVASNFNQALVRHKLLRDAPDVTARLAVLDEAFSNFHRYLFVMPTLARFELELYQRIEQGGAINAPYMNERLAELLTEGYGGALEIDANRLGSGWMNFGHLYAPFYVYQYATGIAAANALATDVIKEGEPAAARYLDFLKAGSSLYPIDALKLAGIDMTRPEPVERGFAVLKSMVDELETIIG
jgi:oligoendopeptidase F